MFQCSSTYLMSTKNGWEVIIKGAYWEDTSPVDVVDRINASFPHHMATGLKQRETKYIAELDKDLLDGLHKVGFRTNLRDQRYRIRPTPEAASSSRGKIKLKNDSPIESFTVTGNKFVNGSELPADVLVFATGCVETWAIRSACGDEYASPSKGIWGLNDEGEHNGNLALCRFYSKHIVLQIKAMDEGIFGTRYVT
ncbi:hypothetical protein GALMADRAFT_217076 [Galerina marginata CBS 339.88]|uniref:FAD/NAD(P)-binding domain-containing protein n=1 Tax=Galerina marginata (strain CBS 339.88) TaxID=685588 RepID=A0A067SF23_GALM3|nr:hypothetical protein GALMADRAFT_217076 [Galerina marginata CBS 339.88]